MKKSFKEKNRIENKVRKGRTTKLTKRDKRFIIIRKYVKNPRFSAVKVTVEFNEKLSLLFLLKLFDELSEKLG